MKFQIKLRLTLLALACAFSIESGAVDGLEGQVPKADARTTIGNEIDDSVVTTRVRSALLADPAVKSMDIKVETRKGTVQLSGYVDSQESINKAIAVVNQVQGVKGVENAMTVKEGRASVGNAIDDSVITTRVKSALFSDPDVKSFDIAVVTRKGQVQLSGYVDNQSQIKHVIQITRKVEGVVGVNNEMSLKR
jgi:hyperosmotically inducible protein